MGLVYRDQLFPRRVFRDMFAALLEQTGDKQACRMTVVHHATIFEMNVESYRRKSAEKAKGRGRPAKKASPADMNAD